MIAIRYLIYRIWYVVDIMLRIMYSIQCTIHDIQQIKSLEISLRTNIIVELTLK